MAGVTVRREIQTVLADDRWCRKGNTDGIRRTRIRRGVKPRSSTPVGRMEVTMTHGPARNNVEDDDDASEAREPRDSLAIMKEPSGRRSGSRPVSREAKR